MLTVKKLSCQNPDKFLLKEVDLFFKPGSITSIIGPNGSGKTTLLKAIAGIQKISYGSILWKNREVGLITRKERSRIMTLVPQSPTVTFDFSVEEFVEMGLYASKSRLKKDFLDICLNQADALHLKSQPVRTLSSGERQRVYIARSLISNAPVMLFDEPTANLDIKHRIEIWKLIQKLKAQSKTVIIATHDFQEAKNGSDEIVVMQKGAILAQGKIESALKEEVVLEAFGVSKSVFLRSDN